MTEPHQTCIAGHPCALRSDRPHTIHTCNDSHCICHRPRRERAATIPWLWPGADRPDWATCRLEPPSAMCTAVAP